MNVLMEDSHRVYMFVALLMKGSIVKLEKQLKLVTGIGAVEKSVVPFTDMHIL